MLNFKCKFKAGAHGWNSFDWEALKYASDELRADRDVVLEAVKRCGLALEYASDELRADRDVVTEAVKNNPLGFDFAGEELQKDIDLMAELSRHIIKRN